MPFDHSSGNTGSIQLYDYMITGGRSDTAFKCFTYIVCKVDFMYRPVSVSKHLYL